MTRSLALCLLALGTALPAAAHPVAEWASVATTSPMPGVELPDPVRQGLSVFVREAAGLDFASVTWVQVTQQGSAGTRKRPGRPTFVVYAGVGSSAPPGSTNAAVRGVMGLLRIEGDHAEQVAKVRIPPADQMKWQFLRATDIDGDGNPDGLLQWQHKARNFVRRGMVVVRTRPAALSLLELDSTTTTDDGERRVVAKVACFFPVQGLGTKALIVQRRERLTQGNRPTKDVDGMELFFPAPDGRFAPGQVFGAMFGADGAYSDTVKAWGDTFGVRTAAQAVASQGVPGDCPASALVLPQRAVGQPAGPDAMTVVGPFATTSDGVWRVLNSLGKRAPRAAVVIGIGSI
ncbi:MAG: hypothetical protein R3F60_14980 [bacterium]